MSQFHEELKSKMDIYAHLIYTIGSLKESKYLLHFSLIENYVSKENYQRAINLGEDIGAMLWGILKKI